MSIQEATKKNALTKAKSLFLVASQIVERAIFRKKIKVFFRYKAENTHPSFDRFYKHPPIPWSNAYRYEIAHWINYPAWRNNSPYLVEVNDHPLSAISYKNRGIVNPGEILNLIDDAYEVYSDKNCKAIVMPCDGFESLFMHYFGGDLAYKFKRLHSPGCVPKISSVDAVPSKINFSCLASDYELKGVDLVLKAWSQLEDKKHARLILACPNIPEKKLAEFSQDSSIVWILKAPLTDIEKHRILSISSVTISPTHVHAGANIIEGMEYGHAIIHFQIHTSAHDHLGGKVEVPYHFYEPLKYGVEWTTMQQFQDQIKRDKVAGIFDTTVEALKNNMRRYINSQDRLVSERQKSLNAALTTHSLKKRNSQLIQIYQDLIG